MYSTCSINHSHSQQAGSGQSSTAATVPSGQGAAATGPPHLPFLCLPPPSFPDLPLHLVPGRSDSPMTCTSGHPNFSFCHEVKGHGNYIPSWRKGLSRGPICGYWTSGWAQEEVNTHKLSLPSLCLQATTPFCVVLVPDLALRVCLYCHS